MSASNYIGTTVPPSQKRKISSYAENHFTERLPRFLRLWFEIITRACEADVPPELILSNMQDTLEFWAGKKKS